MPVELRDLVETSSSPMFGICKTGKGIEWNEKMADITSYATDEAISGDFHSHPGKGHHS